MKKILFCIQNNLIEKVLLEKKILNSKSLVLRDRSDLNLEYLNNINPELIMFPHWSFKIPSEITNNFKCICFHSTPLPYGRGGSPIQNMIQRGHKKTEVCSLLMVEELDAGPIFYRTKVSLKGNLDSILLRVYEAVADQIKLFMKENITPKKQEGNVINFQRLGPKDNKIDFDLSIDKIYDKIRMLDSELYPKGFMNIGDSNLEFSDAMLESDTLTFKVSLKKNK